MTGNQCKVLVCSTVVLLSYLVWSGRAVAQSQNSSQNSATPLVRVLQAKGILTAEEVAQLSQASSASDADSRLAKLLLSKGIISQADYNQMLGDPSVVAASSPNSGAVNLVSTVYHVPGTASAAAAPAVASNAPIVTVDSDPQQVPPSQTASVSPTTISAANPIRPFPVGGLKKGELKPAITVAGVGITPYGFLKATFVHDTSSPGGDDFPLPGFLGDTGPAGAPEFHVKARASRFGTNFEWGDRNPNLTVTGKVEFDFEGNFNRSDNRNLSSIRSSNVGIRLAFGRVDYKFTKADTFSALFRPGLDSVHVLDAPEYIRDYRRRYWLWRSLGTRTPNALWMDTRFRCLSINAGDCRRSSSRWCRALCSQSLQSAGLRGTARTR